MTHSSLPPLDSEDSFNSVTEELLEILLDAEESYPWDLTSPEAEAYFSKIEAEFSLFDALDDAEITVQTNTLFSHLDECWSSVDNSDIKTSLFKKFGQLVPQSWLETITTQAERLATENMSQLTQLVECVRPLWKNWTEDDLQVFARPLAYSMRGETSIKQTSWQDLSEIEQIRLSMAIAQEVLREMTPERS